MADFATEMQELQFKALTEQIGKRNDIVAKINVAQGNRDQVAESVANSSDPEIAELRERLAVIQDEFDSLVKQRVEKIVSESSDDAEGLLEEVKNIDATVKAGVSYYRKLYGENAAEGLPKVVRLKKASGAGGKRIRGYNVDVDVTRNGETESDTFENFASAAKHLGTDTASLQEQFFAKAGVEQLKDAPDEVTFGMEWTEEDEDENQSTVTATVRAYRTGPSGLPNTSESDEDEEETEVDEDDLEDL